MRSSTCFGGRAGIADEEVRQAAQEPGEHFVADCPEKVENKDDYKHKSRMDASTGRGVTKRASTRTSTRTSDDQGRRRDEARHERWWE
jgi:hypothetical protein